MTDLPKMLALIKRNIGKNMNLFNGEVIAKELTWGNINEIDQISLPDVILVADCIYYKEVS